MGWDNITTEVHSGENLANAFCVNRHFFTQVVPGCIWRYTGEIDAKDVALHLIMWTSWSHALGCIMMEGEQMQPVWLWIFRCEGFEDTLEEKLSWMEGLCSTSLGRKWKCFQVQSFCLDSSYILMRFLISREFPKMWFIFCLKFENGKLSLWGVLQC